MRTLNRAVRRLVLSLTSMEIPTPQFESDDDDAGSFDTAPQPEDSPSIPGREPAPPAVDFSGPVFTPERRYPAPTPISERQPLPGSAPMPTPTPERPPLPGPPLTPERPPLPGPPLTVDEQRRLHLTHVLNTGSPIPDHWFVDPHSTKRGLVYEKGTRETERGYSEPPHRDRIVGETP